MSIDRAIQDAKRFVTSGGFEVNITLKTPDEATTLEIKGTSSRHHNSIDTDGLPVSSLNVHITIAEQDLIDNSYPYRNSKDEVSLRKHFVSCPDSRNEIRDYLIREVWPDETLGLIVCILEKNGS